LVIVFKKQTLCLPFTLSISLASFRLSIVTAIRCSIVAHAPISKGCHYCSYCFFGHLLNVLNQFYSLQLIHSQGPALSALSFKPIFFDELRSSSPSDERPASPPAMGLMRSSSPSGKGNASTSMGSSPVPDAGNTSLLDLASPDTTHLIFSRVESHLHFFRE
jgi:hypothetical protein